MAESVKHILRRAHWSSIVWDGVFFRRTLIYILVIASIPGLLLGGGMYFFVTAQIESELLDQHELKIDHYARSLDEQLSNLEISISHWSFEPIFTELMRKTDFYYDFQATRDMNQYLLSKQGSHPLLNSTEVYINGLKPLLFSPSQTLVEMKGKEELEYYQSLIDRGPLLWESEESSGYNPLKLIHTIPGNSTDPFGVVIAALDENKVKNILRALTTHSGGLSMLVDVEKGIMTSTSDTEAMKELDELLWKKVSESEQENGSFVYQWKENHYTVSYGEWDRVSSNWVYISAAPIQAITSPVVMISKTILYSSLAALLLAACMSLLVSNRLYSPVGRLVKLLRGESGQRGGQQRSDEFQFLEEQWRTLTAESTSLQSSMKAQLPMIKEGFLVQLIHGYLGAYSEEELTERMGALGWSMENQGFVVIHIQLTSIDMRGRFSSKDEELITFAAANVAKELAQTQFRQAEVINFHDLSMGMLLFMPDGKELRAEVQRLCNELVEAVNRVMRVRLTITIGRFAASIRQVPFLFQEVKEASIYRDFSDQNQVIDLEELDLKSAHNKMNYSFPLERDLLQFLRMGQQDDVERTMEDFLNGLMTEGRKESIVQQGMLQLLGRMMNTMLTCGVDSHDLFKGVNLFDRLSQIRDPDEMLQWMKEEVVAPFMTEMSERSNSHLKESMEKAIHYLQQYYMQQDISLDNCAEYAGTNRFSLSKAFKLYTGKNFIDYLTELRMDKAKDLIRDTELKIYDIAEKVGYQNGYFNRMFKKMEGITPKQYRERYRK
jgi:AraC-like DNA-binding protein